MVDPVAGADRKFSYLVCLVRAGERLRQPDMPGGRTDPRRTRCRRGGDAGCAPYAERRGVAAGRRRGTGRPDRRSAGDRGRKAFGLGTPLTARESEPPAAPGHLTASHAASAHYRWPSVEVVIAPSGDPDVRRTNTADQLRYRADVGGIGSGHDVLLLTNARPLRPLPPPVPEPDGGTCLHVRRRGRFGGILHEYQHAA